MERNLYGRRLLLSEIHDQVDLSEEKIRVMDTMFCNLTKITCLRCGSEHEKKQVELAIVDSQKIYYCPSCIQLGRVQSNEKFYHLPEPNFFSANNHSFLWTGTLTAGQSAISRKLVAATSSNEELLVWAVTGAGKTEMLFECLDKALLAKRRIGIASPRVDVCLELYPRLQAVFPHTKVMLLHGKQKEDYSYTPLVLCTTHQLLRFYQAFDVLIIDEVDSFPFVNNPLLKYGADLAIKKGGSLIYLTATPTKKIRERMKRNELASAILPARFHRHPLPVPRLIWTNGFHQKIAKGRLPLKIKKYIEIQKDKKEITLIFCPHIQTMLQLEILLNKYFPKLRVASVHAQDKLRLEKVENMRKQAYDILLSTTILERGVTFKAIHVWVLCADHRVFTTESLVQIAGRAGRNPAFPFGDVFFFHEGKTKEICQAVRQIKKMNQRAKKEGLVE